MGKDADQLCRRISDAGLVLSDKLSAILDSLPTDIRENPEALARYLVREGHLTRFQARSALNARTLKLGPYRLLESIGRGGMGEVYKAEEPSTGRQVAIKVLIQQPGVSASVSDRFYQEAITAISLKHPNVVRTYHASSHKGFPFLAMEFIDGVDLAKLVKLQGPLRLSQAVDFVLQAAHGLAYAHDQGIVHRDIKAQNLIVDKMGTLKVLDLGLAVVHFANQSNDDTVAGRLTQYGQVMGTPTYMAPEQASDILFVDCRADVYSLGCTLHFMLTGVPPFQGKSTAQVLQAHRNAPIPSLRATRVDVSDELDSTFGKMVAKNPTDRQQTMHEVIQELSRIWHAQEPESIRIERRRTEIDRSLSQGSVVTEEYAGEVLTAPYGNETYETRVIRFLDHVKRQTQEELAVELAIRLEHRGDQFRAMQTQARAIENYNKAIDIYDRLGDFSCECEFTQNLAQVLIQRGSSWRQVGDLRAANSDFDRAISIVSRLVEQDERNEFEPQLATALRERGKVNQRMGELEAARDDYDQAIHTLSSAGKERREGSAVLELAVAYSLRAKLSFEQEDYECAAEDFTSVLSALDETTTDSEPRRTTELRAGTLRRRGCVFMRNHQFRSALSDYESAAKVYSRLVQEKSLLDAAGYLRECEQQCEAAARELGLTGKILEDDAQLLVDDKDLDDQSILDSVLMQEAGGGKHAEHIPAGFRQAMIQYRRGLDAFEKSQFEDAITALSNAIDMMTRLVKDRGQLELAEQVPRMICERALAWSELNENDHALEDYARAADLFLQLVAFDKRSDLMRELKATVKSRDLARRQIDLARSPWRRMIKLLGISSNH